MTKEKLSNWALRLADMARMASNNSIANAVTRPQQFLIGLIRRQAILLLDISRLLGTNPMAQQQSTLILCRCIVDDFILILHLHSKDFAEEEFIKHTAQTRYEQLSERRAARDINNKYFDGKKENMFNNEIIESSEKEFYSNPVNNIYFSDVQNRKFKSFPSTRKLIESLPIGPIFAANAFSFYIWKYLSSYIHYSLLTFQKEVTTEIREQEMDHVHEALYYAHNALIMTTTALRDKFSFPIDLPDPTNVSDEITHGFDDLSNYKKPKKS